MFASGHHADGDVARDVSAGSYILQDEPSISHADSQSEYLSAIGDQSYSVDDNSDDNSDSGEYYSLN
jgi:hypothetical protein